MMEKGVTGSDRWASISSIGTRVVHPYKENLAFGRLLIPVATRQIQDPDPNLRKRAMRSMGEVLYDPRNAACLNGVEITKAFHKLTQDEDPDIRALLAEILVSLTSSSVGRGFFVANNLFAHTFSLLSDKNGRNRNLICKVLSQVTLTPVGVNALISVGGIPKLVSRLTLEPMLNQAAVLQILHCCTALEPLQAVEENAVEILISLLKSPCEGVRKYAAAVLMDLGANKELGRQQIVDFGGVPSLLNLCSDEDMSVVAKALGALMTTITCTRGKLVSIENSAIQKLLPLLKFKDLEIRLNCLKVLTSLAEAPEGKRALLQNIEKILHLRLDSSPEVQLAVRKAVAVIQAIPK